MFNALSSLLGFGRADGDNADADDGDLVSVRGSFAIDDSDNVSVTRQRAPRDRRRWLNRRRAVAFLSRRAPPSVASRR